MSFNGFNLWCGGIVVLLLLPNIWYALQKKGPDFQSKNAVINLLEQIGRYGSMLFAIVPLGVQGGEFSFVSVGEMLLWLALMAGLLAAYYICWAVYARRRAVGLALALAAIPAALFLVHALLLRHMVLGVFACLFAVCHIFIVYQSCRAE